MLTPLQKKILNTFQHNFPLSERPYLEIAEHFDMSEQEVLSILAELSENEYISRIGPVIAPNRIGVSTLAAIKVAPESLEGVAAIINEYPEVNHNYEREHDFNVWFVIVASSKEHLQSLLEDIECRTGLATLQLPLLQDYFIDLGFDLNL